MLDVIAPHHHRSVRERGAVKHSRLRGHVSQGHEGRGGVRLPLNLGSFRHPKGEYQASCLIFSNHPTRKFSCAAASRNSRACKSGQHARAPNHCAARCSGHASTGPHASLLRPYPRRAASIAAISIFCICIIASNARLARAGSGSLIASVRAIGVICQDTPHLSLHQPHALS